MKRGAFEEGEIRALVGLLCFTGLRPGEAFALRWQDLDLTAGTATVTRNWDHRGQKFTRVVALSGWVVAELTAHKARSEGVPDALVFVNPNGKPMNPSNLRRDVWLPLRKRAKVRELDLYSLRHTFASLGRTPASRPSTSRARWVTRVRRWLMPCTPTACSQEWRVLPSASPRWRSVRRRSCA